eukprot:tig00021012_g17009.t1
MRERLAVAADAISGAESRAEIAEELARKSDLETAAMRERLAAAEDAIREAESRAGIAEDRAHKSDLETAAMRERLAAAEYAIREAESRAGIAEQLASEVPSIIERLAKAEEEASEALEKLADAERALDEETEKRRRAEEAIVAAAQDVVAMSEDAGRDREEDSYVYHSEDDANSRSLLATGDAPFVHRAAAKESFWADGGDGTGRNCLGAILAQVRGQLR